jgi:GTP pyrophosphokinase
VFTPRGDIIDLPAGSTPIDFAYHVHTEVGNRCRGAKVNGKLVTLDFALHTGDQVEVLTAKQGGPSRDWLNANLGLVNTQRARSKIRQWFKWQDREQNLVQGKTIVERELHRLGLESIDLENLAHRLDLKSVEELYVEVGCGDLSTSRIITLLSEVDESNQMLLEPSPASTNIFPTASGKQVTVLGLKGLLTVMARCCNPAPGDEITGYITRGRGVTIHRQDCPNILRQREKERIVKVTWGEPVTTYPVSVLIKAYDRQGLMGDISSILTTEGVNLVNINSKVTHNLASVNIVVEVGSISQLSRILTRIEALPNVMEAQRLRAG